MPAPPPPNPRSFRCPGFISSPRQWNGATCLQLQPRSSGVQSSKTSLQCHLLCFDMLTREREEGSRVNKNFDFSVAHMRKISLLAALPLSFNFCRVKLLENGQTVHMHNVHKHSIPSHSSPLATEPTSHTCTHTHTPRGPVVLA